jgi:hypothetical protein
MPLDGHELTAEKGVREASPHESAIRRARLIRGQHVIVIVDHGSLGCNF